jgi:hypothetical protein
MAEKNFITDCLKPLPRLFLAVTTLWAMQADAQISRRYFVNPSVELPDLDVACGATGTILQRPQQPILW